MKELLEMLPPLLGAFGTVALMLLLAWRRVAAGKRKARSPVSEPLLRPPGHTLAEKLDGHLDGFFKPLFAIGSSGAWLGLFGWGGLAIAYKLFGNPKVRADITRDGWGIIWNSPGFPEAVAVWVLFVAAGLAVLAWGWTRLMEWFRQRHRLHYGLRGEQAVAEQLQAAVRQGYFLFHDLPTDRPNSNLDHALVGPAGVFAIETKARSKWQNGNGEGKRDAKVSFDGTKLSFSDGRPPETGPVRQAEALTRWLESFLSEATGSAVAVKGVIALPGWFVEPNHFPKLIARNPDYFAKKLADAPPVLSEAEITRIAYQLDRRCRDVKF